MALYQLIARALAGDTLSDADAIALDGLTEGMGTAGPSDTALADYLNTSVDGLGLTFGVTDGLVSCDIGCDDLSAEDRDMLLSVAQSDAETYALEHMRASRQAELEALFAAAELRLAPEAPPQSTAQAEPASTGARPTVGQQINQDLREAGTELRGDLREVGSALRGLFRN